MTTEIKVEEPRVRLNEMEGLLKVVPAKISALRSAVSVLPKVDKNGNSECPFAERLFAAKEKARKELEGVRDKLSRYASVADEESVRFENYRATVADGRNRLNRDPPKRYMTMTESDLEFRSIRYRNMAGKLRKAIHDVDAALADADSKKWPLGTPQEPPFVPPLVTNGPQPQATRVPQPSRVLDDLIIVEQPPAPIPFPGVSPFPKPPGPWRTL